MPGALSDIRVIEMGTLLAGPFCGQQLADHGAEVIKIEVSPDELAECRQSLREIGQMPAVTDSGSPILFDDTNDMPGVACVVTEA